MHITEKVKKLFTPTFISIDNLVFYTYIEFSHLIQKELSI
jgi:hypothetical protein